MSYNSSDIYLQTDLDIVTKAKAINQSIIFRGRQLTTLIGVEQINGSLGISDSILETLGDLKIITEEFWISSNNVSSKLTSLGSLIEIGGDLILRYSNITDLGSLQKVGGKLSLRDTPIENLGNLNFVGGDLFLPKRLENKLEISHIEVKGKIRYWNDNKAKKSTTKEHLGLKTYEAGVPYWDNQYINSYNELSRASADQISFYRVYKQNFMSGLFLDIEENNNYSFILYYDLLSEFSSIKELNQLKLQLDNLELHYPVVQGYVQLAMISKMNKIRDYESVWELISSGQRIDIESVIQYEEKLKRPLLNGSIISKLSGSSHLTNFGKRNIEQVIPFATKQLEEFEVEMERKFFEIFIQSDKLSKYSRKTINPNKATYNIEYYKQFYLTESEYFYYKAIDESQANLNSQRYTSHLIEKAILNQCKLILKQAEDLYRESIGMPKIGEGWINETELYYKIAEAFKGHKVIQHASPKWLGRQHLDIYLPELNIGIEYQGAQHYVPIDFFGGQEALKKTIERDKRKKVKCNENNCSLIIVDEDYEFEDVRKQISELIK